jgi:hypothetical protein
LTVDDALISRAAAPLMLAIIYSPRRSPGRRPMREPRFRFLR